MPRLILATSDFAGAALRPRADLVIGIQRRFVWGQLPSRAALETLLQARSAKHRDLGTHWLDFIAAKYIAPMGGTDLGLLELCERCDSIELWADPAANDQLILIWLLDVLRPHRNVLSKLVLVQTDIDVTDNRDVNPAQWRLPKLAVTDDRLRLASRAWNAYRASTPESCFDLLMEDLTALPRLRPALIALLEELPYRRIGLGASEYRMLELVSEGWETPARLVSEVFKERGVFDFRETESIPDRTPVLAGFPPKTEKPDTAHWERFLQSCLTVTDFGKAVLGREVDFSQHNPVNRWWGGTELTPDRLWRWDTCDRCLIAP
ncbi:hypothetical protein QRQ56_01055 [Bradyrhizobium sp. U531]|uniref:hypothetical protein n=1 Tax=Bradyrhizobium sp. U531 TaxID=3053458 RepID=UPI003F43F1B5